MLETCLQTSSLHCCKRCVDASAVQQSDAMHRGEGSCWDWCCSRAQDESASGEAMVVTLSMNEDVAALARHLEFFF